MMITMTVTVAAHDGTEPEDALIGVQAVLENGSGVLTDPLAIWELRGVSLA